MGSGVPVVCSLYTLEVNAPGMHVSPYVSGNCSALLFCMKNVKLCSTATFLFICIF